MNLMAEGPTSRAMIVHFPPSWNLIYSTRDGHVKHGLRPLHIRSAARAALQLIDIRAYKYEV